MIEYLLSKICLPLCRGWDALGTELRWLDEMHGQAGPGGTDDALGLSQCTVPKLRVAQLYRVVCVCVRGGEVK